MSYPGTQAVHRAVQLLKLFGVRQGEWTLAELVEETQLNKTTVFRILSALESEGLLERTERNNYQLGPEMVALGTWAIEQNSLIKVAEPPLKELVGRADVISLHLRQSPETLGMINSEIIASMRPGAMLINTSRGPIVNEEALIDGLRSGQIGTA